MRKTDSAQSSLFDAAPALFLDRFEGLRMELSDQQLIAEAIETNHAGITTDKTLERYRDHLVHYSQYLASAFGMTFYTAKRKHVRMFMNHLAKPGGPQPHDARLQCAWCKVRGYPDGPSGAGWSPSYRKSYLAAIKFLYRHFLAEEDLPDINPAALELAPRVPTKLGYTPSSNDIKKLLECPGTPKGRLLAHWMFYAPSRRQTFADARWRDIDLDQATWRVMGKGEKFDIFDLAPPLIRAFRLYRTWQLAQAARHDAMRDALADPETAYVLMTHHGRKTAPQTIAKIVKWHAVKAGVGLRKSQGTRDTINGMTSRISPHAYRRAWATIALNEKELPIDVVSEVLKHADIATTRKHYAPTKSDRARAALVGMRVV